MKKRVATIILNRNLPEVTDALYSHLFQYDIDYTDIYVIEAGSSSNNLSAFSTWHVNDADATKFGLRYCRGMNQALLNLFQEDKFTNYDAFFLLANDVEFESKPTVGPLLDVLDVHSRIGILSPCATNWGECSLLQETHIKYFWFIHNNAFMLRKDFVLEIANLHNPSRFDFLFDGTNFRGYGSEHELIAKAYANNWAAAITSSVYTSENETHLLTKSDLIKTEPYAENLDLYIKEGLAWMKRKYGFNSHWSMQQYVKCFYDLFFEYHPELMMYKI